MKTAAAKTAPQTFATAYDFALHLAALKLPTKMITYSNQDFDLTQTIAGILTEADRKRGRPAPEFGYSGEHFATAQKALNAWRDSAWTRRAA